MFSKIIKLSGPICFITDLALLVIVALEVKDRIEKRRMKKEHAAAQNNTNEV